MVSREISILFHDSYTPTNTLCTPQMTGPGGAPDPKQANYNTSLGFLNMGPERASVFLQYWKVWDGKKYEKYSILIYLQGGEN